MSFTDEQIKISAGNFLQKPALQKTGLADGREADSFRRWHDAVMMSIGARPEALFALRYMGRNRLLAALRRTAELGAQIAVYLEASSRPSLGNPDSTHLQRAQKHLQQAQLVNFRGGDRADRQVNQFRKEVRAFLKTTNGDAATTRGEHARSMVGSLWSEFEREYTELVKGFVPLTRDFEAYTPDVVRRRSSLAAVERAEQAVGMAATFFSEASLQEAQRKSPSYGLNLSSASAALEMVKSFRSPFSPKIKSPDEASQYAGGYPKGSAFLGTVTSLSTPATVVATRAPGVLLAGDFFQLAVDGGVVSTIPLLGAGQWSMYSTELNLGFASKKLYVVQGVPTEITLTDNPPDRATVLADLNGALPPAISAVAFGAAGIMLRSSALFSLSPGPNSAEVDLGLTAVDPNLETTPEEVQYLLGDLVDSEINTVSFGDLQADGIPRMGSGTRLSTFQFASDVTDLAGEGVQAGDTLVVLEGVMRGRYPVAGVAADVFLLTKSLPATALASSFYVESRRLTISSPNQGTGSSIEILSEEAGFPLGMYYGEAAEVEIAGKDGVSPHSVTANLSLLGVTPGDHLLASQDGATYVMEITSVEGGVTKLQAVSGETPLPSTISSAPISVVSAMMSPSADLTVRCTQYIQSRRGKFPTASRPLSALRTDLDVSSTNPRQLRSRVKRPLQELADLVLSLYTGFPSYADLQAALQNQGLDTPVATLTMEEALLSWGDSSTVSDRELAQAILQSAEERGYDRAKDLLLTGQMVNFASLQYIDASYKSRMLNRMMQVGSSFGRVSG